MNRRAFLRAFSVALGVAAMVPQALIEGAVAAVTTRPVVASHPIFSGEFGVWRGVVLHETIEFDYGRRDGKWGV